MVSEKGNIQLFQQLEDRLAALEPNDVLKFGRDRWVIAAMLIGIAMTVPSVFGAKGGWGVGLAATGIATELCALGILTYRQLCDIAPEFIDSKRKFAAELDSHFGEYEEIRGWLQSFAQQERARRLAYVQSRLESMSQRYPIVFGSADRLGVLPALIGLFLQLQAINELSIATGVVGLVVLVLYGMALWMTRFRLQMEGYSRLLRAADSD